MTNVVLYTENRSEGRPLNSFPGPLTIHLKMAYCQKHFSGHILLHYFSKHFSVIRYFDQSIGVPTP